MSQDRQSGLAMLSIENKRAKKLNVSKVIDVFAELKARKGFKIIVTLVF